MKDMEELENFLKQHAPVALSQKHTSEQELWVAVFQEVIEGPNFSSSTFHRVKQQLEELLPFTWKTSVKKVLENFHPATHELALLNLTHVILAEIQENRFTSLHMLYLERESLFKHLGCLMTLTHTQATKFSMQIVKFIELWIAHLQVDPLDMAEVLSRIVRFTSVLELQEDDLRAKLLSEKISTPLLTICKNFKVFQYASANLVSHILPYEASAIGQKKKHPSVAYAVLKDLMKSPEEGEVEESGIRDKFNHLHQEFDLIVRSPPQSLYSITKETDSPHEKATGLLQYYSEVLPNLSNSNWDTLFIRKKVLMSTYTLKIISLICEGGPKLGLQVLDLIISILANLIGSFNKDQPDYSNTEILLNIVVQMNWAPSLIGSIGQHLKELPTQSVKEFLLILWNYLREHLPTGLSKTNEEPYIRSMKMIIHKNIERMGALYKELQRST